MIFLVVFDFPSPSEQAEARVISVGLSARMFEHAFYASSAAATEIRSNEGTFIAF